jgi:hypothetical protein
LRSDFTANLLATLDSIALNKARGTLSFDVGPGVCGAYANIGVCWVIQESKNTVVAYRFEGFKEKLTAYWELIGSGSGGGAMGDILKFPDLEIRMLNRRGEAVQIELLRQSDHFHRDRDNESNARTAAIYLDPHESINSASFPAVLWVKNASRESAGVLLREKQGDLIISLTEEALRDTAKITVALVR